MVYVGKSHQKGMMTGVPPIFWTNEASKYIGTMPLVIQVFGGLRSQVSMGCWYQNPDTVQLKTHSFYNYVVPSENPLNIILETYVNPMAPWYCSTPNSSGPFGTTATTSAQWHSSAWPSVSPPRPATWLNWWNGCSAPGEETHKPPGCRATWDVGVWHHFRVFSHGFYRGKTWCSSRTMGIWIDDSGCYKQQLYSFEASPDLNGWKIAGCVLGMVYIGEWRWVYDTVWLLTSIHSLFWGDAENIEAKGKGDES